MRRFRNYMAFTAFMLSCVVANAGQNCAQYGPTELVGKMQYCVSSVLASQSGISYGPRNLFDGSNRTAWCEGARGNGAGQEVLIRIEDGIPFRRLLIGNGYAKSNDTYRKNGRVRSIDLTTDRGDRIRTILPDTANEIIVNLPGLAEYRVLKIRIVDVYPGSKYQDTCINFLSPDFEFERYLEFKSQGLL